MRIFDCFSRKTFLVSFNGHKNWLCREWRSHNWDKRDTRPCYCYWSFSVILHHALCAMCQQFYLNIYSEATHLILTKLHRNKRCVVGCLHKLVTGSKKCFKISVLKIILSYVSWPKSFLIQDRTSKGPLLYVLRDITISSFKVVITLLL